MSPQQLTGDTGVKVAQQQRSSTQHHSSSAAVAQGRRRSCTAVAEEYHSSISGYTARKYRSGGEASGDLLWDINDGT
jgi:hypothetical protein